MLKQTLFCLFIAYAAYPSKPFVTSALEMLRQNQLTSIKKCLILPEERNEVDAIQKILQEKASAKAQLSNRFKKNISPQSSPKLSPASAIPGLHVSSK